MASFFGIDASSPGFYSSMPKVLPSVGNVGATTAFNPSTATSTASTAAQGMDPLTLALGLGSSVVGSVGSLFGANKTAKAAQQGSKEATKEGIARELSGFGLDYLTQRYNTGVGAAANRMNTLKDATDTAAFQAYNPALQNLRSNERFGRVQDYAARLSAAMPGYVSPLNLFG
jgi:hypothetical protein